MFSYQFEFSFIEQYLPVLWKGLLVTIELAILTMVLATIFGTIVGVLMSRKSPFVRYPTMLLIDSIRSIPLLVIVLLCYYLFPIVGLNTSPFWPALAALVIDNSAFLGDIVRGSLERIPQGGVMAAKTLGMDQWTILRRIILPEVYRETLPTVVLLYIAIIRFTSLASVIAVQELTHRGDWIISTTFKPLEVYLVIALIYLILVLPLTMLSRRFEKISYFRRRTI